MNKFVVFKTIVISLVIFRTFGNEKIIEMTNDHHKDCLLTSEQIPKYELEGSIESIPQFLLILEKIIQKNQLTMEVFNHLTRDHLFLKSLDKHLLYFLLKLKWSQIHQNYIAFYDQNGKSYEGVIQNIILGSFDEVKIVFFGSLETRQFFYGKFSHLNLTSFQSEPHTSRLEERQLDRSFEMPEVSIMMDNQLLPFDSDSREMVSQLAIFAEKHLISEGKLPSQILKLREKWRRELQEGENDKTFSLRVTFKLHHHLSTLLLREDFSSWTIARSSSSLSVLEQHNILKTGHTERRGILAQHLRYFMRQIKDDLLLNLDFHNDKNLNDLSRLVPQFYNHNTWFKNVALPFHGLHFYLDRGIVTNRELILPNKKLRKLFEALFFLSEHRLAYVWKNTEYFTSRLVDKSHAILPQKKVKVYKKHVKERFPLIRTSEEDVPMRLIKLLETYELNSES